MEVVVEKGARTEEARLFDNRRLHPELHSLRRGAIGGGLASGQRDGR
jgi:hypothetical protein